jgi:hypothetical protein
MGNLEIINHTFITLLDLALQLRQHSSALGHATETLKPSATSGRLGDQWPELLTESSKIEQRRTGQVDKFLGNIWIAENSTVWLSPSRPPTTSPRWHPTWPKHEIQCFRIHEINSVLAVECTPMLYTYVNINDTSLSLYIHICIYIYTHTHTSIRACMKTHKQQLKWATHTHMHAFSKTPQV